MLLRNIFENLARTGEGKTAVIGWGRGMGHKGHMFLASSVITQAKETNADPYFVVSRTVGKDDPINPEEKLAIYKKVFPQSGHIFQTATEEMPDLTRVLTKLQSLGYTDVTVVVGADQVKALGYVKNYNGKPDKSGNIPFSFNTLNVISRQETNDPSKDQEGPRATPMRDVLMDPTKSEQQKFAVWRNAMNDELSDDEVRDLMNKAQQRMQALVKPKKGVAEAGSPAQQAAIAIAKKKAKGVSETPIDGPNDNPMIYGHQGANPAELKTRIMRARGQLKDLSQRSDTDSLLGWESIARQFPELAMNVEQIRHAIEELAKKRKKGGISSRGIDPNIGEEMMSGSKFTKGPKNKLGPAAHLKATDDHAQAGDFVGENWELAKANALSKLIESQFK